MNGLFKKFLEFAIGNGIVLIIGLASTPIITRIISEEQLGKFSIFTMVTSLIMLVTMMGGDQSYIRYFHEEEEQNRMALLKKCIKMPLIVNISVGMVLLLFYKPISIYVSGEVSFSVALLILINTTFTIVSNFSLIHVRMKQRAKMYSLICIINKVVYLGLTCLFFLIFRDNFIVLVLATVIANLAMLIAGIIAERKDWFSIGKKVKLNTNSDEIIKYGTPFIFSMAIIWIFQSIDKVSIKAFCGYSENGLYAATLQIVNLLNTVQGAFTTFWTPVAFERYSKHADDKEFFIKINKIVTVVMLVLAIGLIATKDLIVLFLGPQYRETVYILPFLVFMPIMYTISETTVVGINFNKKSKCHIYISIASAITNIIGNIILVPKLGAKGAAIATGIAYVVFFAARTYYSNKFYKVNYPLKRFALATAVVYVFATYSSFYKFNMVILTLAIISTTVVLILYRDIVKECYEMIKEKVKNRKSI